MGNKKNGLLALLGLGALAYWKYKKSTPEEKQKVKDTINTAKDNITKFGNDLKGKVDQTLDEVKSRAGQTVDDVKAKAEEVKGQVEDATQK